MKKVLLATSALVAFGGAASADVNLSGYGRFGMTYNSGAAAGADETNNSSRFRIQADVSTTTDNGITVGARQRFQTEENAGGNGGNGVRFYVSANGLTLGVGNVIGAIEGTPNLYLNTNSAGMGLEGNGFRSLATNFDTIGKLSNGVESSYFLWTAYDSAGAGAQDGIELQYSIDGLTVYAHKTDFSYGLRASYAMDAFTFGVGYEEDNSDTITDGSNLLLLTAGMKMNAFDAKIAYGKGDLHANGASIAEVDKVSISGGYTMNDLYVMAFATMEDNDINLDINNTFGLGMNYSLGGGVSFDAGWTRTEAEDNVISAGLFFSF